MKKEMKNILLVAFVASLLYLVVDNGDVSAGIIEVQTMTLSFSPQAVTLPELSSVMLLDGAEVYELRVWDVGKGRHSVYLRFDDGKDYTYLTLRNWDPDQKTEGILLKNGGELFVSLTSIRNRAATLEVWKK